MSALPDRAPLMPHSLADRVRDMLDPAETVIDVGAGIRPLSPWPGATYTRIEPYPPYADALMAAGHDVVNETALDALPGMRADLVLMFDVIEHMHKEDGIEALALAKATAAQVAVFTPNGFMHQDHDAWGMGGEHWQTHRSGWTEADFPAGWERYVKWFPGFLLAIWR